MYAGGGLAYLGPTCLALGAGSGVSLVTFRNEFRVFYPLNFTPTLVGTDCAAVVAVNQSLGGGRRGVYVSRILHSPLRYVRRRHADDQHKRLCDIP
jgi:hypothetical protein